jgi:ribosome biogenesis SPOUT family RNA methylase Rps3
MGVIVVEHLEEGISRWMLEEYKEAVRVAGDRGYRVVIAGVAREDLASLLESMGVEALTGGGEILYDRVDAIVLDPWAPKPLEPWEAERACCFIIGGIMGDHPPKGRTRILSWRYMNAAKRNLGPYQLSIDGAVKVALMVASGLRLSEIDIALEPTLHLKTPLGEVEVQLPYAYPLRPDGRPWIAEGVVRLLASGIMWEEEWMLKEGL